MDRYYLLHISHAQLTTIHPLYSQYLPSIYSNCTVKQSANGSDVEKKFKTWAALLHIYKSGGLSRIQTYRFTPLNLSWLFCHFTQKNENWSLHGETGRSIDVLYIPQMYLDCQSVFTIPSYSENPHHLLGVNTHQSTHYLWHPGSCISVSVPTLLFPNGWGETRQERRKIAAVTNVLMFCKDLFRHHHGMIAGNIWHLFTWHVHNVGSPNVFTPNEHMWQF